MNSSGAFIINSQDDSTIHDFKKTLVKMNTENVYKNSLRNITIDEYRAKLLCKIAGANSEKEILRYVNTAIAAMYKKKVHGHLVSRFIEKVLLDLSKLVESNDSPTTRNIANCQKNRHDNKKRAGWRLFKTIVPGYMV